MWGLFLFCFVLAVMLTRRKTWAVKISNNAPIECTRLYRKILPNSSHPSQSVACKAVHSPVQFNSIQFFQFLPYFQNVLMGR